MLDRPEIFTRTEVTTRGFEASCIDATGVRFLWHLDSGLRRGRPEPVRPILVTDPAALARGTVEGDFPG